MLKRINAFIFFILINDMVSRNHSEILAEKCTEEYSKNVLIPVEKHVFFPRLSKYKKTFFMEDKRILHGLRGKLALYLELFWKSVYGGVIHSNHGFYTITSNGSRFCQPDISHNFGKWYIESKTVMSGGELKLLDDQIEKYGSLQVEDKNREISFAISRHGLRGIEKKFKNETEDALLESFSKGVFFSIILPFSIINEIHKRQDIRLVYRYDPPQEQFGMRYFKPMTRVRSQIINLFLRDPETAIKKFRLNPDNYIFNRQFLTTGMDLNGHEIKPFPILEIKDKDLKLWFKKFKESYKRNYIDKLPF